MKKFIVLLLIALTISSNFAQAPQSVTNVGQISWYGLPSNCIWTATGGQVNAPCLAGTTSSGVGIVNAGSAPYNIVGDNSTDNTAGFALLNTYLQANPCTTVLFPPGIANVSYAEWLWNVSCVTLVGTGPTNNQSGVYNFNQVPNNAFNGQFGGDDFRCQSWTGATQTINYFDYSSSLISTTAANATQVHISDSSSIASWQVGDDVLIAGWDQQAAGYPPNYRNFDRTTISALNIGAKTVNLTKSLSVAYNALWPFFAGANTTPPFIRNLTRSCTSGGGSLGLGNYIKVVNMDFSKASNSVTGVSPAQFFVNDSRYAELVNSEFDGLTISQSGTVIVNSSTIAKEEIDKLVDKVIHTNSIYIHPTNSADASSLAGSTGANFVEVDNSTFNNSNPFCGARNCYFNNDTLHSAFSTGFGYIGRGGIGNAYYGNTFITNPVFYLDGTTENGLWAGNLFVAVTAVSTPSSHSFTVSGASDIFSVISILGPGSPIFTANNDYTSYIGTVTDVTLVSGVLTVTGTWTGGIGAFAPVYLDPNPLNLTMNNPTMADGDINLVQPTWNFAGWNSYFNFDGQTTVADLGTCNFAQKVVTKWVRDATGTPTYLANAAGGGTLPAQVFCNINSGNWVYK